MTEIWKEINGYKISNCGTIIGKRGKPLSKNPDKINGYLSCNINLGEPYGIINGQHRVIALLFCDGYEDGFEVNHKDADKTNNRADNLEWCTHDANMKHVSDNALYGKTRMVCIVSSSDEIEKIYNSIMLCCYDLNLIFNNVRNCCGGLRDSHKGIKFRFYNETLQDFEKTRYDKKNIKTKGEYRKLFICNQNGKKYSSQKLASEELKISQSSISEYLRGVRKLPIHGYTFEFI